MRYVVAIVALVMIIGALVAVKATQIGGLIKMGKEYEKNGPPPETVSTTVAEDKVWESTVDAVGTIASARGVAISNEIPGTVVAIRFESGQLVKQGDVLVELDSSVERAQLAALEARRELAVTNTDRTRALVQSQAIAKSQLDTDEATLKSSRSDLSALQATIGRKVVRAPFAGRLGIRNVNLGQYLQPGMSITVLESTDALFVDFTVPQQELERMKPGNDVRVTLENAAGAAADAGAAVEVHGKITAADPNLDSMSRTLKVRATLPADDKRLRPGMFANVSVVLPEQRHYVTVPAVAIIHASYGDSVFVTEDKDGAKWARQKFIKTATKRGDFVAVAEGLDAGQAIVTGGAFKLRNNTKIVVDNKLAPDSKMNPTPENH